MTAIITATPETVVDTSDMNAVHTIYRREFRLAAGLVRSVANGDTARAAVVDAHLAFLEASLHHHHEAEDAILWPILHERVPADVAPIVELMETHHERIGAVLTSIEALRPRWAATAQAGLGAELADLYDENFAVLAEHMAAEETQLLPIAARTLTEAEWHSIGEHATSHYRKKDMPLLFGMLAYEADPRVIQRMIDAAPAMLRLLVPRLGRRAFRKHALQVHGTATP